MLQIMTASASTCMPTVHTTCAFIFILHHDAYHIQEEHVVRQQDHMGLWLAMQQNQT